MRLASTEQPAPVAVDVTVRIVVIVRAPHRVDVELLHQPRILLHQLTCDGAPPAIVVIVAIDAVDPDRPPVHEQPAFAHLDRPEADPAPDLLVTAADEESVEGGLLGAPASWPAHACHQDAVDER